jgi:hypothetical protein
LQKRKRRQKVDSKRKGEKENRTEKILRKENEESKNVLTKRHNPADLLLGLI